MIYEAENAELSGKAFVANDHSGYSGTGFVCGYGNVGAKALFTVNVPKEGDYSIKVRYSNASEADKTLSIYVNGEKIGSNTISLQRDEDDGGSVNLDYLLVE